MRIILLTFTLSLWLLVSLVYWAFSADLHITVTTKPPGPIEVAIVGEAAPTTSSIHAIILTSTSTTFVVPQAQVDALHTTWVCVTARAKGTQVWWTNTDGTYTCRAWPTVVPIPTPPPPPDPPPTPPPTPPLPVTVLDALRDGLNTCLTKKLTHIACMKALNDSLLKVTP